MNVLQVTPIRFMDKYINIKGILKYMKLLVIWNSWKIKNILTVNIIFSLCHIVSREDVLQPDDGGASQLAHLRRDESAGGAQGTEFQALILPLPNFTYIEILT